MRILWIKTELLHPVDKGGRIRTYHMLRSLSRRHDVTYVCLDDGLAAPDAIERALEYAQSSCCAISSRPCRTPLPVTIRESYANGCSNWPVQQT